MKIAIVATNIHWQSGGTRQIFELARRLGTAGHRVTIYAPFTDASIYPDLQRDLNIKRVELPNAQMFSLHNNSETPNIFSRVASKIREAKAEEEMMRAMAGAMDADFDVLNYHDFSYEVGYFYKKINPKVRNVWTMNEPPFGYVPKNSFLRDIASRFYNFLKEMSARKFIRAADVAITLDDWDYKWVKKRGVRAVIVWSGLDFGQFYFPVKKRAGKGGTMRLLAIGNPNRYRRFEDIIEAVKLLRDEKYDVRLTVNAKNIWHEDAYCESLKALRAEYGLQEAVELLFDGVSEKELKEIYSKSDAFVHSIYVPPPRDGSTWGLVVFEAMAAGMPVVLCRTAGASEPFTDGKNALFIDPMSPDQIRDRVKQLMDGPDFYNQIAEAGQSFTKENISWEKYTNRVIEVFGGKF